MDQKETKVLTNIDQLSLFPIYYYHTSMLLHWTQNWHLCTPISFIYLFITVSMRVEWRVTVNNILKFALGRK